MPDLDPPGFKSEDGWGWPQYWQAEPIVSEYKGVIITVDVGWGNSSNKFTLTWLGEDKVKLTQEMYTERKQADEVLAEAESFIDQMFDKKDGSS